MIGEFFGFIIEGLLWTDGFMGFIMSLACIGLVLGIILLVGCMGVFVADNVNMHPVSGSGTVTEKQFVPTYTTSTTTYVNNIPVTTTTVHPDSWYITIQKDNLHDRIEITHDQFDALKEGQSIDFMYVKGRFTGGLYIKKLLTK